MIGRLTDYLFWYHTVWVFVFLAFVGVTTGVIVNSLLHFHGDDAFLVGLIFFLLPALLVCLRLHRLSAKHRQN